jgi:hypothetical protein
VTKKEKQEVAKAVARAIGRAEIRGTSVGLLPIDATRIREQIADAVADECGALLEIDAEQMHILVDVARMT